MSMPGQDLKGFDVFRDFLVARCGIVLSDTKKYLVTSRLSNLMAEQKFKSLIELVDQASKPSGASLRQMVIDAMTTNETLWFRDTHPFDILLNKVIPSLDLRSKPLRIWSAACSSGQEPYSIAITLTEALSQVKIGLPKGFEILATDISSRILNSATQGEYDSLALARGLSEERKSSYFEPIGDGSWRVKDKVRENIRFRPQNLLESYQHIGKCDVIFCRNVLIYFSENVRADIIKRMSEVLNEGGYLFLGASESISGLTNKFDMVHCTPGIVYKKK